MTTAVQPKIIDELEGLLLELTEEEYNGLLDPKWEKIHSPSILPI